MMLVIRELFCVGLLIFTVSGQTSCPLPWQHYGGSCYLFYQQQMMDYPRAVSICNALPGFLPVLTSVHCKRLTAFPHETADHGSSLVSINNLGEHDYIIGQIRQQDSSGYMWYTSGKVDGITEVNGQVKWQGDGTETLLQDQRWLSDADRLLTFSRVVFKTDGVNYGWSKCLSTEELPFVCEISQLEAYRIFLDQRDFTYGTNYTDVNKAPRGPKFVLNPENIVVVHDSRATTEGEHFTITLECFADGNPMPTYTILQTTSTNGTREITPNTDTRYTLTGGSLAILNPTESHDAGIYQCVASNQYGTIFSEFANVTFGVLEEFSNVQRAPVVAEEYRSVAIECGPPPFRPAVSYQWYRSQSDFVRPDLNPYMFISSNGKLYFSEVTQNDEGDYHCIVKLTSGGEKMSTTQPPSRISLPIPLDIVHQVPTTWGPEIADGFIASFPNRPLRGNTVKLECLAYGTLPLTYEWSRKDYRLPDSVVLSDHNRIMEIFDARLEDSGTYYCTVRRNTGQTAQAVHTLVIETKPYFILPLPDLHADVGSRVTWRCEAKAIPRGVYIWYKDGVHLQSSPGDFTVVSNVITFQSLDATRHAGMYMCAAINTHGVAYSSAQLRILVFKPSFTKNPLADSQSAALGGHVTIVCSPEAAPKPEFSWSRNGANLNPSPDDGTSRVRLLANGNLYIGQIQYGDAGEYCCTATNHLGADVSCGNLKVVPNTVMSLVPINTIGNINRTAVLLCRASFPGNVDHLYIWRFNGKDINHIGHPHYIMGTNENPGALYVTSAQYRHSGVYTCIAKTTYDTVNASASLVIEGPPGPNAGVYVTHMTISNTTATVIWTEGEAHGRPVDFHNIEACTDNNKTWIIVASGLPVAVTIIPGSGRHHFHVQHLKPGNSYYFRVRGINALGTGLPSRSSVAYKIPGSTPIMYPTNVGGGGGVVGILQITWDPLPPEDQGSTGIGYIVHWRLANSTRAFTEEVVEGNKGMFATTVGSDYYYLLYEVKVRAFNDLGMGPVSPNGVYAYSAENLPKGIVSNVYAWPYNATAIKVSWNIVPNDREHMGGTLLGYQVNYKIRFDPDAGWEAISWRGETHDGVVIGLDPYFWYSVDIQILNTAGMGPRSEIYHSRTFKEAPRLFPIEVHVTSHTSQSVLVTWRGIGNTPDEENVEGYVVRYWHTTDDIRSATDVITERVATEAVVYGIRENVIYECRIFAYSRGGDGKHSQSVYFTLGGLVPLDPSTSEIMASASHSRPCLVLYTIVIVIVAIYYTLS